MNYTENYQLPQWEKTDRIMMEDFNEAMLKLDGAPRIFIGTYKGTGGQGSGSAVRLSCTVEPRFVAVFSADGLYRLLCARGCGKANTSPNGHSYGNCTVTWGDNTVSWYATANGGAEYQMNVSGSTYTYFIIG